MKKKLFFQILIGIFFLLPLMLYSQNAIYVKSNGNDNNDGRSETAAYKTLEKAFERVSNSSIKKIIVIGRINGNHRIQNIGSYEILITGKPESADTLEKAIFAGDGKDSVFTITGNIKVKFEEVSITNKYVADESDMTFDELPSIFRGGGIYVGNGATTTLGQGTLVIANKADYGGGIYILHAKLILDGGNIRYNLAVNDETWDSGGGGVYLDKGGDFTMISGLISDNIAISGGGVYVDGNNVPLLPSRSDDAIFTMQGGTISKNTASRNGGGIAVSASFIMNGGKIDNNEAQNGGGIYGDFLIRNGIIENNKAIKGGGIYSNTQNRILDCSVINNSAEYGGGIYIERNTFTFSGGNMSNNKADFIGGGIYLQAGSVYVDNGGRLVNNSASDGDGNNIFRQ